MPVARSKLSARPCAAGHFAHQRDCLAGSALDVDELVLAKPFVEDTQAAGLHETPARDRWQAASRSGRLRRKAHARRRRRRTRRVEWSAGSGRGNQARSRWSRQVLSKLVVTRTSRSPARSSISELTTTSRSPVLRDAGLRRSSRASGRSARRRRRPGRDRLSISDKVAHIGRVDDEVVLGGRVVVGVAEVPGVDEAVEAGQRR